jgi:hypothetical protein
VLDLRRIIRQFIAGRQSDPAKDEVVGGALPQASPLEKRVADWAVDSLCPAIYAALSDGLLPQIQTLFGSVPNSLWKVVEISSQLGMFSRDPSRKPHEVCVAKCDCFTFYRIYYKSFK